jgi:hypothetical protein
VSEPIKTQVAAAMGPTIRQSGDRVHQVAVSPTARALSTLSPIDYADAFLIEVGPARQWWAEQCGRAVLDGAPLAVRTKLLLGWSAIGLKPAVGGLSGSILGWQVRVSAPEFVLLGRDSLIGMPAELLFMREHDAFVFCTFVQHNNLVGRAIWALIEATHVRIVRDLLGQAARRLAQ